MIGCWGRRRRRCGSRRRWSRPHRLDGIDRRQRWGGRFGREHWRNDSFRGSALMKVSRSSPLALSNSLSLSLILLSDARRAWRCETRCASVWKRIRRIDRTTISKFYSNSRSTSGRSPTWPSRCDGPCVEWWSLPSWKRPALSSWTTAKNSTRGLSSLTGTSKLMAERPANPAGHCTSATGPFLPLHHLVCCSAHGRRHHLFVSIFVVCDCSFGITPTMDKLYHRGVMRTKCDDCQFVCITQTDYFSILHKGEENTRRHEENGRVVLVTEQRAQIGAASSSQRSHIVIKVSWPTDFYRCSGRRSF